MLDDIDRICEREFQEFCSVLLHRVVPGFQAVGGSRDKGDDGFYRAGEVLFQMYGPHARDPAKLRGKIDQSLAKAVALRSSDFPNLRTLAFVTNFDLHHDDQVHLHRATEEVGLACEPWGKARLAAALAKPENRDIRELFPRFLLPDIAGRLDGIAGTLRDLVEGAQRLVDDGEGEAISYEIAEGIRHQYDRVFGPDHYPDVYVLQADETPGSAGCHEHRAYDWFRMRFYCEGMAHRSFEPEEEDAFLADVCGIFWESASRSPSDSTHVAVERRGGDLKFHRRWEWWTDGILAFAATLPDPSRPGLYSVADLVVDIMRFFGLAVHLGAVGPARVVFEIDPHRLRPDPSPSDAWAREVCNAGLDGILEVVRPVRERTTGMMKIVAIVDVGEDVAQAPDVLAGHLVVKAMRDLHQARISSKKLIASIPALLGALDRARAGRDGRSGKQIA
jgi:hypothetical protein